MEDVADITVKEKDVSKMFVEISGEELPLDITLDFIEKVQGSTPSSEINWTVTDERVGNALADAGLVYADLDKNWYTDKEEQLDTLFDNLYDAFSQNA